MIGPSNGMIVGEESLDLCTQDFLSPPACYAEYPSPRSKRPLFPGKLHTTAECDNIEPIELFALLKPLLLFSENISSMVISMETYRSSEDHVQTENALTRDRHPTPTPSIHPQQVRQLNQLPLQLLTHLQELPTPTPSIHS